MYKSIGEFHLSKEVREVSFSMFVVPIVRRELKHSDLCQAWILLERNGSHLISVESEEAAAAFAAENGLVVQRAWTSGDCIFQDITPTASLADFYTWAETPMSHQPMREVWRPFLVCKEGDTLGLIQPLKEIAVGPTHTVGALLQRFSGASAV